MAKLPTREDAIKMDQGDPLAHKREEFALEDGIVYMCGNSLGPMPKKAFSEIEKTMKEDWAKGLITSHNKAGWFMLTETIGNKLGKLLGADDGETVLCDSTGINIYKTLHAAISMRPGRKTILCEASSFPTDLYMIEGVTSLLSDMKVKLEGRDANTIEELMDEDTAVVLTNQVDYRSGVIRDIKSLTQKAHAVGALVISDLCHSAGAIPVDLHDDDVDFAIGCTYKYLNAGPGAPAFAYVAKRHHGKFKQPLMGWHGHAAPFNFELSYRQGNGAQALLCGTQPTLSAIPVRVGLEIFDDITVADLYQKAQKQSAMFISLIETWTSDYGLGFYSPKDSNLRNGQVSLTHEHGYPIMLAMIARGITGDFRKPNVLRFGFTPLFLRYVDVWDAAQNLREIMQSGEWQEPRFNVKNLVT